MRDSERKMSSLSTRSQRFIGERQFLDSRRIPSLQANFYCLLRRHLNELRKQSKQDQVKLRELERTETLVRDIVNCRVRKIVALAASPAASEEIMQGLTLEEKSLYAVLNKTIEEWKVYTASGV